MEDLIMSAILVAILLGILVVILGWRSIRRDPQADVRSSAAVMAQQLAVDGWRALPCRACDRHTIITVDELHRVLTQLAEPPE